MSGWDTIDPRAGRLAQAVNNHTSVPIFWDTAKDRATVLAILKWFDKETPKTAYLRGVRAGLERAGKAADAEEVTCGCCALALASAIRAIDPATVADK